MLNPSPLPAAHACLEADRERWCTPVPLLARPADGASCLLTPIPGAPPPTPPPPQRLDKPAAAAATRFRTLREANAELTKLCEERDASYETRRTEMQQYRRETGGPPRAVDPRPPPRRRLDRERPDASDPLDADACLPILERRSGQGAGRNVGNGMRCSGPSQSVAIILTGGKSSSPSLRTARAPTAPSPSEQ